VKNVGTFLKQKEDDLFYSYMKPSCKVFQGDEVFEQYT